MNTLREMKEIIEAAIEGKVIEYQSYGEGWIPYNPTFNFNEFTYRVKPEPKPDVIHEYYIDTMGLYYPTLRNKTPNLKITLDGETGELIAAEVMK